MEQILQNLHTCIQLPTMKCLPSIKCATLAKEYAAYFGKPLAWSRQNFETLEAFLDSIDCLQVYNKDGESCVRLVFPETAHLKREQERAVSEERLQVSSLKSQSAKSGASQRKRELSVPAEVKQRLLYLAYTQSGLPVLLLPDKYKKAFLCQMPSLSSMGCTDLLELLRRLSGIAVMKNGADPELRDSVYCTRLPRRPDAPAFPEDCAPPGYRLGCERMRRLRLPARRGQLDAHQLLRQQYEVRVPLGSNSGPGRFFVILSGEASNRRDKLMEQLEAAKHPALPEAFALPGLICVAASQRRCRRVRIVGQAAGGGAQHRLVEDVDSGELLTVDVADLRGLHRRFAEGHPGRAILCRLAFLMPGGGADRFSEKAVKEFHQLTRDVRLKLTVDQEPPPDQPQAAYSVYLTGNRGQFLTIFTEKSLGVMPIQVASLQRQQMAKLAAKIRQCRLGENAGEHGEAVLETAAPLLEQGPASAASVAIPLDPNAMPFFAPPRFYWQTAISQQPPALTATTEPDAEFASSSSPVASLMNNWPATYSVPPLVPQHPGYQPLTAGFSAASVGISTAFVNPLQAQFYDYQGYQMGYWWQQFQ